MRLRSPHNAGGEGGADLTSLFTIDQVAERLRKSRKWLQEWLCEHPTSWSGMPYYAAIGRTKLFTDENIRWIARAIEDQKAERKEHNEAAKNDDGFIYFMEAGDFIKIGYTRSPAARGIKMSTDNPFPLRLLHIEDGTFKRETLYHRHFAAIRVRGEWFHKTPELLTFIEQRKRIIGGGRSRHDI
jgi:hypothetical protein